MFYAVEQAKPDSSSSSGTIVGIVAAVCNL
jgi:hypothetical protein